MSREIVGELFPNFTNYTDAMWFGNEPAGKGHEYLIENEIVASDRWDMKNGGGESVRGKLQNGSFSLNHKITVYIVGDYLNVVDLRYDGKQDVWEYSNQSYYTMKPFLMEKHFHKLESDRLKKILNHHSLKESVFGNMVLDRAIELLDSSTKKEIFCEG